MAEIPIIGRGKPGQKTTVRPPATADPTKPNPVYYKMNLLQQCGEFFAGAARSYESGGLDDEAKISYREAAVCFWKAAQIVEGFIEEVEAAIRKEQG